MNTFSIAIHPSEEMIEAAERTGTDRIELYTEAYASNYHADKEFAIKPYIAAARLANKLGLGINAGHDLDLHNLNYFSKNNSSYWHKLHCRH